MIPTLVSLVRFLWMSESQGVIHRPQQWSPMRCPRAPGGACESTRVHSINKLNVNSLLSLFHNTCLKKANFNITNIQ